MGPRNDVLGGGTACEFPPLGPSVELPMGPRNGVLGGGTACEFPRWDLRWSSLLGHETLYWAGEPHASSPIETLGEAPYGATKRCTGWGNGMRPHWDLGWYRMGPRNGVLGGGTECEFRHWDLRWSSLWGHETLYWVGEPHASSPTGTFMGPRNVVLGGGTACEFPHWDPRWSSLWGHETCEGCAEMTEWCGWHRQRMGG